MSNETQQRLRCDRFEEKPKEVKVSPNYRDFTRSVDGNSSLEADLDQVIDCIEKGISLPRRFYRAGLSVDEDELLTELGIKHLHLGNMGSDVLLFAVEYGDRVVLLEVNTHKHFNREPKGSVLLSLHRQCLRNEDAASAEQASDRTEV